MIYFILSVKNGVRATGMTLVPSTVALLVALASAHPVDAASDIVHTSLVGITLLSAWIIATIVFANSYGDTALPISGQSEFASAPSNAIALLCWRLGSVSVVIALAVGAVLLGRVLIQPRLLARLPLVDLLQSITAAAAAAALVVALLTSVLPRSAAIAASGGWLLLSSAGGTSHPMLERLIAEPLFPLSQVLVDADESLHLSGSLRAVGSVALFDLGLLLLLVAIGLRERR